MKLSQLTDAAYSSRLRTDGIILDMGLVCFSIYTHNRLVDPTLRLLYADYPVRDPDDWFDFNVSIASPAVLRSLFKPQANFMLDEHKPFLPLPFGHSYPLLEWGMNWCVANYHHTHLILHAAVLEKDGNAFIFPAPPGSGKSTLCTYLAMSGWRLLSDEMAVIDLESGRVKPFVRPICLKNDSISLVKEWFPNVTMSPIARDTKKGDVAHVRPPASSVMANKQDAKIKAVVFPKYVSGTELTLYSLNQCQALTDLADNAFNHEVLGIDGFSALCRIVEECDAIEVHYSELAEVMAFLEEEYLSI